MYLNSGFNMISEEDFLKVVRFKKVWFIGSGRAGLLFQMNQQNVECSQGDPYMTANRNFDRFAQS